MRTLRIKLADALRKKIGIRGKAQVAKEIGISVPKLQAILDDHWEYITRDSIERVADYLESTVEEVFEFVPSVFWHNIISTRKCNLVRGGRQDQSGLVIPMYDNEATQNIQRFLHALGLPDAHFYDDWKSAEELVRLAKTENCIVVGSPKSNPASEILLSHFFGAKPFDPSETNRRKIPFGFCWPQDTKATQESSLTCSSAASSQAKGKPGIAWEGGQVQIDFHRPEQYQKWETDKGRDCGLVFVADQPFGTKEQVKLIVLAGMSGIGTVAAAIALLHDFRDLQPLPKDKYVLGIIEAHYTKRSHKTADGRTYKSFRWVYREGGRDPVEFKKNPNGGKSSD